MTGVGASSPSRPHTPPRPGAGCTARVYQMRARVAQPRKAAVPDGDRRALVAALPSYRAGTWCSVRAEAPARKRRQPQLGTGPVFWVHGDASPISCDFLARVPRSAGRRPPSNIALCGAAAELHVARGEALERGTTGRCLREPRLWETRCKRRDSCGHRIRKPVG